MVGHPEKFSTLSGLAKASQRVQVKGRGEKPLEACLEGSMGGAEKVKQRAEDGL
jgi:hypothetical protein